MDSAELARIRQAALDAYNYDETYAMQPAEVAAMAVTMRRFTLFQERFLEKLQGSNRAFVPEMYVAAAMLANAAAIVHLEEIIRVPAPEPVTVTSPEGEKEENPNGVA